MMLGIVREKNASRMDACRWDAYRVPGRNNRFLALLFPYNLLASRFLRLPAALGGMYHRRLMAS